MAHRSEPRLLVLHALRLKGVGQVDTVAAAAELPAGTVSNQLGELAARGLADERDGVLPGWTLTPAGRTEHEQALHAELDEVGARPTVEAGYRCVRHLNPGVLDACSRWQVREVGGRPVRNDHHDRAHDARVLADLEAALHDVRPAGEQLAGELERFSPYAPRLSAALDRALSGDGDYVAKPVIPSFHTVWFELHEDLLLTLGLDRAAELQTQAERVDGKPRGAVRHLPRAPAPPARPSERATETQAAARRRLAAEPEQGAT